MNKREFGDFQTPPELVREILQKLANNGPGWTRVLEPTCGIGNFIRGVLETMPVREIHGIELQARHAKSARTIRPPEGVTVEIREGSLFDLNLATDLQWNTPGPLLVVGNPPWVTNAELGSLGSLNLPKKSNFKRHKGIDAITGASNFDIAEFIWLKILSDLRQMQVTVALLCKTSVARNVLRQARREPLPVQRTLLWRIDAPTAFGASVEACLLLVELNDERPPTFQIEVFRSLASKERETIWGFVGEHLISDLDVYRELQTLDGVSPVEWRQGIKHDAASVMELTKDSRGWVNGLGEVVEVEEEFVFPLLKGSDIANGDRLLPSKRVIVTQRSIGENTRILESSAPRLWRYLTRNRQALDSRKSSIYKGKAPFSIFGVGPYSFSPFKVAVSGLHKEPRFLLVGPKDGKPVMLDDTCYMLAFESALPAAVTVGALSTPISLRFIKSLMFRDSKRPITKSVLQRIDLRKLVRVVPLGDLRVRVDELLEQFALGVPEDQVLLAQFDRESEQHTLAL